MKIHNYLFALACLLLTQCAKDNMAQKSLFQDIHYEKMIDISLQNFINERLDKKFHSPENSVILLKKSSETLKWYYSRCKDCIRVLERPFVYKKKKILGYDIRPKGQYNGSKKKIRITFSDPYVWEENHPNAWKENKSIKQRVIQFTGCQGDFIRCKDYYNVFDISTGEVQYVKTSWFVSSANLD